MRLSLKFIKNGCRVNIVFDGTRRHHSNRSTTKRFVEFFRNKVDYHFDKCNLLSMIEDAKYLENEKL